MDPENFNAMYQLTKKLQAIMSEATVLLEMHLDYLNVNPMNSKSCYIEHMSLNFPTKLINYY